MLCLFVLFTDIAAFSCYHKLFNILIDKKIEFYIFVSNPDIIQTLMDQITCLNSYENHIITDIESIKNVNITHAFYGCCYNSVLPSCVKNYNIKQRFVNAKICFWNYGYYLVDHKHLDKIGYDSDFFNHCDYLFTENELNKEHYRDNLSNKSINIHVSGCVKLDFVDPFKRCVTDNFFHIMWCPRWTPGPLCSYNLYVNNLIDLVNKHDNIILIYKPHPFASYPTIEIDDAANLNSRIIIDRRKNVKYIDYFKYINVIISDPSSMIAEAFGCSVPIIYTKQIDHAFNYFGDQIQDSFYTVSNSTELTETVVDLLNGNDSKKSARDKYFTQFYEPYRNSCENILDILSKDTISAVSAVATVTQVAPTTQVALVAPTTQVAPVAPVASVAPTTPVAQVAPVTQVAPVNSENQNFHNKISNTTDIFTSYALHIDITIPLYLYNSPIRTAVTLKVLNHYANIIRYCKKYHNTKITMSFVGSEQQLSKSFIEDNFNEEYTYDEFDQSVYDCIGFNSAFLNMLTDKFKRCYQISMRKKPNISLLAGSNDYISLNFFEQIIKYYNPTKDQLFGINGYDEGKNITGLDMMDNSYNLLEIDKIVWWSGILHQRTNYRYIAGIIGFNDSLYNKYYDALFNNIINFDEGEIESRTFHGLPNIDQFNSRDVFFINMKSDADITSSSGITSNITTVIPYTDLSPEFTKRFKTEYYNESFDENKKWYKHFLVNSIETHGKPGKLTEIKLDKICLENNIQFNTSKYFYVTDLNSTDSRGNHSNNNASEMLICMQGSFDIKLHNGSEEVILQIKQNEGIFIDKNIWISYYNFKNCVILAFVCIYANDKESCCNFSNFLEKTKSIKAESAPVPAPIKTESVSVPAPIKTESTPVAASLASIIGSLASIIQNLVLTQPGALEK